MNIRKVTGHKGRVFNSYIWEDVQSPKGVIQLIHGMAEHVERYDHFAQFLNFNGYIVVGSDLRGHGKTAAENNSIGVCEQGDSFTDNMRDQILLTKDIKAKYNLPVVIFGHSYGSFVSQAYIQQASSEVAAVVLCGSAKQSGVLVAAGRKLACIQAVVCDKNKPAKLISGMTFGPFDAKFSHEKTVNAWLSTDLSECEKYNNDKLCGFKMSIDFYRSLFVSLKKLYTAANMKKIKSDLPIYIISGDMDPVGGYGKLTEKLYKEYVKAGIIDINMKLYKGSRHEILNDAMRDEVMFDVLAFADRVIGAESSPIINAKAADSSENITQLETSEVASTEA